MPPLKEIRGWQWLAIIGIFFILPITIVGYLVVSESNRGIRSAEKELLGTAYLRPLRRLMEHVHDHHILTNRYLLEREPLTEKISKKVKEIDEDIEFLDTLNRELGEALKTGEKLDEIKGKWRELKNNDARFKIDESNALHHNLIAAVRSLMSRAGDYSNLILDPDLDSYYLMDSVVLKLPEAEELICQVSSLGETLLEKDSLSLDKKMELIALTALIKSGINTLNINMDVAFRENPQGNVKQNLGGALKEYIYTTDALVYAINNRMVKPDTADLKLPEFIKLWEDAFAANLHLYDLTIEGLDALLKARIKGFSHKKYGILSVVTLIIILMILFAFLSMGSIKDSMSFKAASKVLTPVRLLAYLIAVIFIAELSIMLILHYLMPPLPNIAEEFVDSFFLIAAISPFLYIFAFRPMLFRIREYETAERALREGEEKYRSLVETVSDAVVMIDEHSNILFANHALEDIFGYTMAEIIGKKITMLMPEHLRAPHINALKSYIVTGVKKYSWRGIGFPGLHKSGKEIPLEISVGEFLKDGRHIFTGIVRDVTERKEAEERLQHYTIALERSNSELQDFAYICSHDLQEPLRKVIAFGDRLKMRYSEILGEDGLDYLKRMNNATGRMQTLINDLLVYSRVTTKVKPFKPTNLKEVVSQIVVDLENLIALTGGQVEIGELPVIEADKTQMFQLFQNLIANALKFHKAGENPVVTVKSRYLHSEVKEKFYEITVEDNGIGFDEKYLDRIFKPFERLHGKKEYEGTGMGLPICRKIVNRHGGDITAKSSPDKGSAFIVTLPEKQKS